MLDDGLVIDVTRMKGIFVEPAARTATAQTGLTWGEFDRETHVHGLATTGGLVSTTGIAGLTLGGGVGWLMGRCGLVCDNTLNYDVVLASGEMARANTSENADLFWALKGGGGNFGVVTRFTFGAQEFGPMMRVGVSLYEPGDAAAALREYAAIVPTLPRSVGWHAALKHDIPALPFVPQELVGRRLLMFISM